MPQWKEFRDQRELVAEAHNVLEQYDEEYEERRRRRGPSWILEDAMARVIQGFLASPSGRENPAQPVSNDLLMAKQGVQEEERAVGIYQEMLQKAVDPDFQRVLAHVRDEEIEHADEFRTIVGKLTRELAGMQPH